jgi:hypothetical protein
MHDPIPRREAVLRTSGVAALSGLAVVQVVALPYALVQGVRVAVVCVAVAVAALGLAAGLATAGADAGRAVWRGAVVLGALTLAGWLVTRAVAVPGVPEGAGRWTSAVGLSATATAAAMVWLGGRGMGVPRGWHALRGPAVSVLVALAAMPLGAIALAGIGPAPTSVSAHHHGVAPATIARHPRHVAAAPVAAFRPGFGGHTGHYVYANATRPHLPPWALALVLGAAASGTRLAAGSLARRSGAAPAIAREAHPREGRMTVA